MRVSFDFDGTLTVPKYFNLAKKFIEQGCEFYITTARHINKDNSDLYRITNALGVPKEKIRFTNFNEKLPFVKDFDLHFDDDNIEIEDINLNGCKCIGVLVEAYKYNAF